MATQRSLGVSLREEPWKGFRARKEHNRVGVPEAILAAGRQDGETREGWVGRGTEEASGRAPLERCSGCASVMSGCRSPGGRREKSRMSAATFPSCPEPRMFLNPKSLTSQECCRTPAVNGAPSSVMSPERASETLRGRHSHAGREPEPRRCQEAGGCSASLRPTPPNHLACPLPSLALLTW